MDNRKEDDEIDLLKLFQALWRRAWAIVLAAVICGGIFLGGTLVFIKPLYKSQALMYVNNSNISVGNTKISISQADLSAAQSLVDTYIVILKTRSTLNEVIAESGVSYTYEQLKEMITAASVNSTEIFSIEVTSTDPKEAEVLANTIARILPEKISSVVDGSSVRIVDYAVVPAHKDSPDLKKNTLIGVLLGGLFACGLIVLLELLDDQIRDSDYLLETYDIPVLAVIPDLLTEQDDGYYRYYQKPGNSEKGRSKRGE